MEVSEAVAARRSIRKFLDKPVPEGSVRQIMEAARLAPSASNVQSWKFKPVRDFATRQALRKAAFGQAFIEEAPLVIVACVDIEAYGERVAVSLELLRAGTATSNLCTLLCRVGSENLEDEVRCITNAMINVTIAVENMVLTAASLGLGTCWVRAFEPDEVASLLSLPPECPPLFLLPIGYPAERPHPRPRKSMEDIMI